MATSEWKCKCGIVPAGTKNTCHHVPLRVRIERLSALTPQLQFLFSYIQMLLLLLRLLLCKCMLFLHLFDVFAIFLCKQTYKYIHIYAHTHTCKFDDTGYISSNGIYCVCVVDFFYTILIINISIFLLCFFFLRAFIPILITDFNCTRFCSLDIARLLMMMLSERTYITWKIE